MAQISPEVSKIMAMRYPGKFSLSTAPIDEPEDAPLVPNLMRERFPQEKPLVIDPMATRSALGAPMRQDDLQFEGVGEPEPDVTRDLQRQTARDTRAENRQMRHDPIVGMVVDKDPTDAPPEIRDNVKRLLTDRVTRLSYDLMDKNPGLTREQAMTAARQRIIKRQNVGMVFAQVLQGAGKAMQGKQFAPGEIAGQWERLGYKQNEADFRSDISREYQQRLKTVKAAQIDDAEAKRIDGMSAHELRQEYPWLAEEKRRASDRYYDDDGYVVDNNWKLVDRLQKDDRYVAAESLSKELEKVLPYVENPAALKNLTKGQSLAIVTAFQKIKELGTSSAFMAGEEDSAKSDFQSKAEQAINWFSSFASGGQEFLSEDAAADLINIVTGLQNRMLSAAEKAEGAWAKRAPTLRANPRAVEGIVRDLFGAGKTKEINRAVPSGDIGVIDVYDQNGNLVGDDIEDTPENRANAKRQGHTVK